MTSEPIPPVRLTNAAVSIGGRPILRGIDLTVPSGEFLALLGANGSGKSTLVRAMTGLLPLATGTLELFGAAYDDFHDWHRLGFVPQRSQAVGGVPATVREIVASGRVTHRRPFRPLTSTDRRAIADALEVVGLTDRARTAITNLSGGQQQRALIARALAGQPELLVLDEPTAGVDLTNQRALADALGVLKERATTIILVAHEIGPMQRLIDRTVVMRDGRISYDGPPLSQEDAVHAHHGHGHVTTDPHAPQVASPFDHLSTGGSDR